MFDSVDDLADKVIAFINDYNPGQHRSVGPMKARPYESRKSQ